MEKFSLVEIEDLNYTYPGCGEPALRDICLKVLPGEFMLIAGLTGSGKSTLCRAVNGLVPHFYGGKISGNVRVKGISTLEASVGELARYVGLVFQDPEAQLVFEDPEREIAFGLENLAIEPIRGIKRIEEVFSCLRLASLRDRRVTDLSGGEKQKIALASVLVMQPEVIVLDEPTSQLDPVSAEDFLVTLKSLNSELGISVILAEHRLERCFHLADKIVVLHGGRVVFSGTAEDIAKTDHAVGMRLLPPISRLFLEAGYTEIPLNVKEGRMILSGIDGIPNRHKLERPDYSHTGMIGKQEKNSSKAFAEKITERDAAVKVENLWHSYGDGNPSLKGVDADFGFGEVVAIVGENGSGKTTLVKNITGILKPSKGRVILYGRDIAEMNRREIAALCGMVMQNPESHLISKTPEEELRLTCKSAGFSEKETEERVSKTLSTLDIESLRSTPVEEISCGQRELVAIGSVVVRDPDLLILDEPTRGLDSSVKERIASLLARRKSQGKTTIVVTHDLEFVAEFSDRVIMLAEGRIIAQGEMREVLSDSLFYTTQYNRCFRGFASGVVTKADALKVLKEFA